MAKVKDDTDQVVAQNRKARYNYFIEDSLEVGLMLTGSEVKSLRLGRANIGEAYAREINGELFLINAHITEYAQSGQFSHEPTRPRKLLLKRRQLDKLLAEVQRAGVTLVPLKIYFNARGFAKLELGIARGKKQFDKRETEKQRDWSRQKARLIREKG